MENEKKPIRKRDFILQMAAILFLPVCVLYFEFLFSIILHYPVTLYNIGYSMATAGLLFGLSFILRNQKVQFVMQGVLLIGLTLVFLSQFLYYRIFQVLYAIESIQGAGKAATFSDILFGRMKDNAVEIFFFLLPSVLFFVFQRVLIRKIQFSFLLPLVGFCVFVLFFTGTTLFVLQDKAAVVSPRYMYRSELIPDKSMRTFGLLTTMRLDFRYNIMNIRFKDTRTFNVGDIKVIESKANSAASESETTVQQTETLPVETIPVETIPVETLPEITPFEPNIMDINFDRTDGNETQLEMNRYFSQREPTLKNEYTGLFKGKNLILITAEGFSRYAIDPVLTPTLYKLSTEGFVFNNFYTPIWGVSTSDGEFVATTGLIPKAGKKWSYTEVADNYMPFAFGNQFKALGYVTKAYHDHTYTYYNRDLSYPNMGYDYKGVGNGLDVAVTWPESDVEMMQLSVPEYVNTPPFHVYYMTVSGHLEYNFSGNFIAKKNEALVEDLPYSDHVKAYLACQIELDRALENLLQQLSDSGQLENTVIALSPDHYPYGLEPEEYNELAGHDLEKTFERYKGEFILWSGDMKEPVVVDKYCSSLDIAPTLANLFGLTYDSRLYMGTDILSTKSPVVVFQDRSFITDKIMYNANNNTVQKLTDEDITDEYIESCIAYVTDEFSNSAKIISDDYYRYLFQKPDA